jgi:hypothetical protein
MSTEPHPISREMHLVHDTFRREFGLLPALVRAVGGGDVRRAGIIADHYAVIRAILQHHHHAEDEHFWPRLLARSSREAALVVSAMRGHHDELDTVLAEVTARFAGWRETADRERGMAVGNAASLLSRLLNEHLAAEEDDALPLIEQHVTQAEWNQGVEAAAATADRDQATLFMGMMMYEGDPDAVKDAIGHMPPEVRPVITGRAAAAFRRHCVQVYGTPTPTRIGVLR